MLQLSTTSLDWALRQAELTGNAGIFPLPFEFAAIRHEWDALRNMLSSENILDWGVRPNRECLSPKSAYGFRIATQVDPLDYLIYNALVYEIGADIESQRVSQGEEIVFSWRFQPRTEGTMFDRTVNYLGFRRKMRELVSLSSEQHVVVTDITDFFPKLGHHRVENALSSAASTKRNHAKAIVQLLSAWRATQSFGIPIGPNASRLIAEIAISDIDQALLAERLTFVRYVDDYRIFCKTEKDARKALVTLADVLWKNHGLTLSEQKTHILPVNSFEHRYLRSEWATEVTRLSRSFEAIMNQLGLDNPYEDIEHSDLDPEQRDQVDALNLEGLLTEQFQSDSIDIGLTQFVLRRLSQLQDSDIAPTILTHIDQLYPIFVDVISYLNRLKYLSVSDYRDVGRQVLDLMKNSVVSDLEYHRLYLLNLFASSSAWGNVDRLPALLSQFSDHFTRRKVILALGQAGRSYWFRQHRTDWQNFSPWERRALIRGASSMEGDERRHWYDSIQSRLDPLEKAIVSWSRQNPIYA